LEKFALLSCTPFGFALLLFLGDFAGLVGGEREVALLDHFFFCSFFEAATRLECLSLKGIAVMSCDSMWTGVMDDALESQSAWDWETESKNGSTPFLKCTSSSMICRITNLQEKLCWTVGISYQITDTAVFDIRCMVGWKSMVENAKVTLYFAFVWDYVINHFVILFGVTSYTIGISVMVQLFVSTF
jgi:hypothetical protein